MGTVLFSFFWAVVGIIVHSIVSWYMNRNNIQGDIVIDNSDPEEPYVFLESNISLRELSKYKRVQMNVVKRNFLQN